MTIVNSSQTTLIGTSSLTHTHTHARMRARAHTHTQLLLQCSNK